jgi:hypothetical protein
MHHFRLSFAVTVVLMCLAGWWGYEHGGTAGLLNALWITAVLGVLEVSLSFDNAVVNASVLRHWNEFWRKLFLTVGIVVAVFGMRLLFPLVIVSVATGLGLVDVWHMAIDTPQEYSRHLTEHHAEVSAFGGAFLMLVFLNFLFDSEKELHWLGWIEEKIGKYGSEGLAILLTLLAVFFAMSLMPEQRKLDVLISGVVGVLVYVGVDWISSLLEEEEADPTIGKMISQGSIGGFLYLEVLDASFSFDGVIGAFAITNAAGIRLPRARRPLRDRHFGADHVRQRALSHPGMVHGPVGDRLHPGFAVVVDTAPQTRRTGRIARQGRDRLSGRILPRS